MWESVIQFWQNNSSNIIVSLIVGLIFFVLGPLGLWFSGRKVRRERVRKAKEVLIDLLEGMIVSRAQIDERKLRSLFRSIERDIDIDLSGDYHIDHWLGDVALRFERSRHLSSDQKQSYYENIRSIMEELHLKKNQAPAFDVPRKYEPILNELKSSVSRGDVESSEKIIEELERSMAARERSSDPLLNVFKIYRLIYKRSPVTFIFIFLIVMAVYAALMIKFLPELSF